MSEQYDYDEFGYRISKPSEFMPMSAERFKSREELLLLRGRTLLHDLFDAKTDEERSDALGALRVHLFEIDKLIGPDMKRKTAAP